MMNKKGISTLALFGFILVCFLGLIFLGIAVFGFKQVSSVLDVNVTVAGTQTLGDINALTFGKVSNGLVNNADTLGVILIMGMVLLMILNAFLWGSKSSKLWIFVDILILVFIFITSVYVSRTYSTFITAIDSSVLNVYTDNLPLSSKFVLNLPYFVGIIGALIMIVSYSNINKDQAGGLNVGGF